MEITLEREVHTIESRERATTFLHKEATLLKEMETLFIEIAVLINIYPNINRIYNNANIICIYNYPINR